MKLDIVTYDHPVLRQPADPVSEVDDGVLAFVDDMFETMYESNGIGLAAQQVGKTTAICVIDLPPDLDTHGDEEGDNRHMTMPLALINPIVSNPSGSATMEEGCLSFPGLNISIDRATEISLAYTDVEGQTHEETVKGMLARVVQHEVDHLNGVLFIDHVSPLKRLTLAAQLKRMQNSTA